MYVTLTLTTCKQTFVLPIPLTATELCVLSVYNFRQLEPCLLLSDVTEFEVVNNGLLQVIAVLPVPASNTCLRKVIVDEIWSISLELTKLNGLPLPLELPQPVTVVLYMI
jgi:hypothetical protein